MMGDRMEQTLALHWKAARWPLVPFVLAALITFSVTFALAAGTMKTAIRVLTALILFIVFGSILVGFIERVTGVDDLITPVQMLHDSATWPGPFHVFGGNWMLIDV